MSVPDDSSSRLGLRLRCYTTEFASAVCVTCGNPNFDNYETLCTNTLRLFRNLISDLLLSLHLLQLCSDTSHMSTANNSHYRLYTICSLVYTTAMTSGTCL